MGLVSCLVSGTVILSDLAIYTSLLQENVERNRRMLMADAEVVSLDWMEKVPKSLSDSIDVLLISDCIYYEEAIPALVNGIKELTHPHSTLFLSYERRSDKLDLYHSFFSQISHVFSSIVI